MVQFLTLFNKWERWQRVGAVTLMVALTLFGLEAATSNPNLVPVTLLAMSLVVPSIVIFYLLDRYDQTGISLRTLSLTFLAGGTIGIIVTVFTASAGGLVTGGLLLAPLFAGLYEEPAKLLATSWRWKHPVYGRPMDGLILGVVSGLGFAVFESAGYGLQALLRRTIGAALGHDRAGPDLSVRAWFVVGHRRGRVLAKRSRSANCGQESSISNRCVVGRRAACRVERRIGSGDRHQHYFSLREFRRLLANRGYRS